MKILLVEDNPAKRVSIKEFVHQEFPQDSLSEADSFILGLRRARDSEPDLILLDMSLPHHSSIDSGARATDMRPFAGADFLKRVNRNSGFNGFLRFISLPESLLYLGSFYNTRQEGKFRLYRSKFSETSF